MLKNFVPQGVKNIFWHLPKAIFASIAFGFPTRKMKLIGVTGTDGKTTTVSLIHHILEKNNYPVASISSITAKMGDETWKTPLHTTSVDSWQLQKIVREMVRRGVKYLVLEVSSHGLDQYRFWGCRFEMGVLTNITHDHLDYHKTFDRYLSAKAKLFSMSKLAILNADDASFQRLNRVLAHRKVKMITYGIKRKATISAKKMTTGERGILFYIDSRKVNTQLWGDYNVYNILASLLVAESLGIREEAAIKAIESFAGVKGRMEEIKNNKGVRVFIDFASTPNALKNALEFLRKIKPKGKKLIAVFGSAGLRDVEKRPMMGEIGCSLADVSIITAEDPRTESLKKIIDQMVSGCRKSGGNEVKKRNFATRKEEIRLNSGHIFNARHIFIRIPNRQEAINFAIRKVAEKGDLVVTCGKGHEQSMCFGKVEYPWSEHEAVRIALSRRKK